jgi:putative phosphoesterase
MDDHILHQLSACDEIWHAGDFGTLQVAQQLEQIRPLRGVSGNVDGADISSKYPEKLRWKCEDVTVFMMHIGGYPERYAPLARIELARAPAQLFISGHSHILKIVFDEKLQCLHMNPGAAGRQGWHHMRTLIRFSIDGKNMKDCEVVELGKRG